MGKVNPVSAKYVIKASINAEGTVDRPDVIGAVFGQTEGFLGNDLELRELQRSGKVGRIEVNLENKGGKSVGTVTIPCSLDKAEAAIIAAALETIERIGPCNAKVVIQGIDDVRTSKRDFVINRAKELLNRLQSDVLPDSQDITQEVSHSMRTGDILEWGPDKLAAGPDVESNDEMILVEGRADVVNLLKHGFKNVMSMNGTSIPDSVKQLCKKKTVTVFVDGDRGGDLIVRELLDTTKIAFVTKAPDGKEVEELAQKELHLALRSKVAAKDFKPGTSYKPTLNGRRTTTRPTTRTSSDRTPERRPYNSRSTSERRPPVRRAPAKPPAEFKPMLDELVGTRGAYFLDKDFNVLGKVPAVEIVNTLKDLNDVCAVVFDGEVTKDSVVAAEKARVKYLVGMTNKTKVESMRVRTFTKDSFK
jgi:DNA primase